MFRVDRPLLLPPAHRFSVRTSLADMPITPRRRFLPDSLGRRLLLLVVLALLPSIGLTIFGAMRERQHAVQVAESDLQRLTGLAAASEANTLEGVHQFLVALSDVPDLMREPEVCAGMLRTMLKKNPAYLNLGVLGLDGQLRCSARPADNMVNLGDRVSVRKTIATGKFATGDHLFGPTVRRHAIDASFPVQDDSNRVIAVLIASIDLNTLDQFAADIDFPRNAVLVTTDGNGTVIARRPDPLQWVGTRAERQLRDLMLKVRFGTAEITGADGIRRLHAFAPVGTPDTSNYTLSIGIPMTDIVALANQQQTTQLLTLTVTAVLALLMAWFVANVTILSRVRALLAATRKIADGAFDTRSNIRYGREEISELARAFDSMAASLQRGAAERDEAAAHLFAEKERALVTLQSIGDGVITTDADGRIDSINPVAAAMTGWSNEEARGRLLEEVFNVVKKATREPVSALVPKALTEGRTEGIGRDCVLISRDGSEHAVEDSVAPIRDRAHAIIGTVVVFHDVSHARRMADQLSHQASHDPLTGLVNRREFERRLQLTLDHGSAQPRQHALLFMDLDRFKIVNDTCGHHAGDELLRQITALLRPLLRDSDTLARIGGDEFAALLENCSPAAARRIAEKLCRTVCDFRFAWRDQVFPIGVSIGLVNFGGQRMTMTELVAAADSTCYQAKDEGRNRVCVHAPGAEAVVAPSAGHDWPARINQAFEQDRFVLLSREAHSLGAVGRPICYHTIELRLCDEAGMLVLPGAFLPSAERHGLMPRLDRWLMRRAFAHHARVLAERGNCSASSASGSSNSSGSSNHDGRICGIGLSTSALDDPLFVSYLSELMEEFSLPPETLCFEIAETTAISHLSQAMRFIDAMKPAGCLFALDDFGSGMSSFAYLAHLRVDYLKIDGAFIVDMANDPIDQAKVEAINHVGHAMGMRTIAKHVGDKKTVARLRTIRVDLAQGDAISAAVVVPNIKPIHACPTPESA